MGNVVLKWWYHNGSFFCKKFDSINEAEEHLGEWDMSNDPRIERFEIFVGL